MAFGTARGKIHYAQGTVTTAQAIAGALIVPGRAGKRMQIVGGHLTAAGAAAGATSVDIKDTASDPIVAVACAVAGLTDGTQLDFDAGTNVARTTYRKPLTAGKGLQVKTTGEALTTTTAVDYYIEYVVAT